MKWYTVNTNKKLFATALLCLCTLFPQAYADDVLPLDPTIPTLDYLYSKGESAISSAYTLTPTQETTGENIINIPFYNESTGVVEDSYYKWEIKENVVSQPTLINDENLPYTNFEGHYINTDGITNRSQMGNIYGDFARNGHYNIIESAIENFGNNCTGIIDNIYGDFIKNTSGAGGAILNVHIINNITGNFIGNYSNGWGGAILNEGTIGNITGNFIGNRSDAFGTIFNRGGVIGNITGDFIDNTTTHGYGAISNIDATIGNITGNFIRNNIGATSGGAISNGGASSIGNITGDFIENSAPYRGGAISNSNSTIESIDGSFINNFASLNQNNPSYLTNNAYGGAIYSNNDINLVAKDDKTNYIKGNTVTDKDGTRPEAIYMAGAESNLNIKTQNKGKWEISDQINGVDGYTVNMIGDGTGSIALYNDILNANVTINATNLSTMNNDIHTYHFNSFTVNGNSNMAVDVNLAQGTMDKITADAYGEHNGNINVSAMNLLSDSKTNKQILFAEEGLAQNVKSFGRTAGEKTQIASPVRMYDVVYNIHDDNNGYFEFTPGANINNGYNYFNPAVLATPIALQTGVQSVFNTTKRFAFTHSDKYAKLPSFERNALINQNKYAFGSTIFNQNLNYSYSSNQNNKGIWVKPYTAFESIPLKNGPEVTSITYGTFLGYDSDFHEHKNGWNSAWTLYAGYNGGQLDYKGGDASLNGGSIGFTDTFYKGNFWSAITATTGAIFGDISTRYGRDDTISVLGGLASRTGYNLEFNDGRFIIQPIMGLSYSFSNTFDYHNSAGVKIDAKPLHTLQINPALRFIGNTKSGWQPYASVGMVWNLLNETNVTADGYKLPEMHIKPYIEYGLGLQKTSSNGNFTGFGQALVRNGGRNGVALTFGFRYLLGKD